MIYCRWYTGSLPEPAEQIRREVFVNELGYTEAFAFDGREFFSWNLLVWEEEIPKAVGRLTINEEGAYVVQYLAVLPPYRRHLLGDFALRLLVDKALSGPPAPILADVPEYAESLFSVVGFRYTEDKISIENRALRRMIFPEGGSLHGSCGDTCGMEEKPASSP